MIASVQTVRPSRSPGRALRILLAALPLIAGLGAAEAQTLRIGMRDDSDILDSVLSRTYVGTVVMTAPCDKLFDFDEKLNIVPMLATGYERTDEKKLVLRLRSGDTFHDGTAFDVAAVKYALVRHLSMQGSYCRSEIGAMDHAEVVDPLTIRVVMKPPFAPLVAVLTARAGMMVSPRAAGRDFGRAPACAGPVRFVERVAQDRVVVRHYPGYWDAGRIHDDRVDYSIMPNSTARLANLQSGTLDLTEVAPLDAEMVTKDLRLALASIRR
jgi:peptide/nickel transport system substrate-binding protein